MDIQHFPLSTLDQSVIADRCLCIPADGKAVVATQHKQQIIVMHPASLGAAGSDVSTPSLYNGCMFPAALSNELWVVPEMPDATTILPVLRAYSQSLQKTCQAAWYVVAWYCAIAMDLEAEKHWPRHSVATLPSKLSLLQRRKQVANRAYPEQCMCTVTPTDLRDRPGVNLSGCTSRLVSSLKVLQIVKQCVSGVCTAEAAASCDAWLWTKPDYARRHAIGLTVQHWTALRFTHGHSAALSRSSICREPCQHRMSNHTTSSHCDFSG